MKALARHILCLLLTLVMGPGAHAQANADVHTREGDKLYQQMAYAPAMAEYKVAAEMGALNEHVVKRLADCYMRLGDTRNAETWYAQVVKFLNREPRDLYNYAQALKSNAKYEEAELWMDRYLATTRTDGPARKSNISDFAKKFNFGADRYTVRHVGINTPLTDMVAGWAGPDQVLIASARRVSVGIQRRAAWNDEPFLDLYRARVTADGSLADAVPLEGRVNSKLHEGPAVCDAAGGTMWFTRTNPTRAQNGIHRLSILRARKQGNAWGSVEPFLYNNPECSVGHPALSPDGTTLYFVSDMPGGYGGTDIYRCFDTGGQWGEPENLGPVVNTEHDEMFPFVGADGTLWFASNGQPGLGGLDIFATTRNAAGELVAAVNAGAPVNSPKDDFGLIIDPTNKRGYFTSDRDGGLGGADIYRFEMHRPIEQRFLVSGVVIDDEVEMPVIDAQVTLFDDKGIVVATTTTDSEGKYAFPVEKGREYKVRARMPRRYDAEQHLSTEDIEQRQILARDLHMVPDAGIWLRAVVRWKDRMGFVENAKITVVNLSSFFSEVRTTGAGGDASFRLQADEQFEMVVERPGSFSISIPVNTRGMKQGLIEVGEKHELEMEPIAVGKPLPLRFVKWSGTDTKLDPVARTELDMLADRLQTNAALKVEIGVHSDARGDQNISTKLSQQRADAVVAYLRTKGVAKDNLTAKGYGGSQPLNECGPGVQCTDAKHAENQRTEYTVVGGTN